MDLQAYRLFDFAICRVAKTELLAANADLSKQGHYSAIGRTASQLHPTGKDETQLFKIYFDITYFINSFFSSCGISNFVQP